MRAEKTLTNGLTIVKDFQLSTNYLVSATVRLENRSAQPLALPAQEWVVGTATPMGPRDKGLAVGVLWYNGIEDRRRGRQLLLARRLACMPRIPPPEYRGGNSNVVWVAAHNQFFTLALMPQCHQQLEPRRLSRSWSARLNCPAPPAKRRAWSPPTRRRRKATTRRWFIPALTLAPHQTFERQIYLFAGPEGIPDPGAHRQPLQQQPRPGHGLSGFFGLLRQGAVAGDELAAQRAEASPYGWAIIVITVIIKVVFWPLTQASTRSMKRMQALQPQMNAIKEKYKDDPVKMNKKTMEFMKENKVSPLGGCLPMLLQIPVFFGFYSHDPERHRAARRPLPLGRGLVQAGHALRHSRLGSSSSAPWVCPSTCCR